MQGLMRSIDNGSSTMLSEAFLEGQPTVVSNQKVRQKRTTFSQRTIIAIALLFTVAGVALSISALLLPSWQVVHLFEYNSVHEHGLWLDCTRHSRDETPILRRYQTESEPLNCVYKWDYDETAGTAVENGGDISPVGEVNRHRFYGWQVATMILIGLALITSLISLCIGCCSCTYRYLTLVFSAITLLNFFLSSVAVCVFFFYSHRADNRFINGIVGTYEQRVGLAFFLELGACIADFIAFLLSILIAFLSFSRRSDEAECVSRMSHLSVSNLHQGMDIEPPMLYQDNKGAIIRSPPHYTKYHGSYSKVPTSSIPDVSTPSLRRGSETCV